MDLGGFRRFGSRLRPDCLLNQARYGVSRLGALANPILNAIGLELDLRRLARWIVGAQIFQISAVALRLLFLHYDAIRRPFLGAQVAAPNIETPLFVAGSLIVVFAFFAGRNGGYRGIWLLMLLPLAIRSWRNAALHSDDRRFHLRTIAWIVALLWIQFVRVNLPRIGLSAFELPLLFIIREPRWWMLIIRLMAMLWGQLSATPIVQLLSGAAMSRKVTRGYDQHPPVMP